MTANGRCAKCGQISGYYSYDTNQWECAPVCKTDTSAADPSGIPIDGEAPKPAPFKPNRLQRRAYASQLRRKHK